MSTMTFPTARDDDADDVALALETGEALWENGKASEAIRWLRRAAASAEQLGSDLRAVSLARTAAELATTLESPVASKPPPRPGPSTSPPPSSVLRTPPPPPAASGTPLPPRASRPPPPSRVPSTAVASREPAPPGASRPPPAPTASRRPPPPSASRRPPPPSAAPPPRSVTPAPSAVKTSIAAASRAPSPARAGGTMLEVDVRGALHVSIKQSPRDEHLYLARTLDEKSSPPPGSRRALVVFLDGAPPAGG